MAPEVPERDRGLGSLVRHSLVYSAVPVVSRVLAILLVPFYTTYLSEARWGVVSIGDLWLVALAQILGQNLLAGMVRFYFDHEDAERRARVVSSCTVVLGVVSWIVCGSALLIRHELVPVLLGRGSEVVSSSVLTSYLGLILLVVPFQLSTQSGLYYLQIQQRSSLYSGIQISKTTLELGLKIVLIAVYGLGIRGYMLSVLIGEALTTVLLTGWMLRKIGLRVDWSVLRPILAYTAPLVPVGLCQLGLHQLDRRLIEYLLPPGLGFEQTGIYDVGYKLGYAVNAMMLGPFLQIWQPWIYAVKDPGEQARLVARVSTYALVAVGAATLPVALLGREAVLVLTGRPGYEAAFRAVPWVAGGYVLWALYHVSQIPLFIAKRTGRLFVVNLVALAVNVGLDLWLIPSLGFVGAAIATCATFAVLACLGMAASWSELHVPFELGRLGVVVACVAVATAAAIQLDLLADAGTFPHALAVAVKVALGLVLAVVLVRGVLRRDERRRLRAWVRTLPFAPAGAGGR